MQTEGTWTEFSPKQLKSIQESIARINIWHGSIRSGKTISSLIRWLIYLRVHPSRSGFLMVGKTERTLKRNILDVLENMLSRKDYKLNQGDGVATICGKKVLIAGANDVRAEEKIRGLTLCGSYGDEITLWPQNFFVTLLGRNSIRGSQMFFTTNPDSPFHYVKTDYIDKKEYLDLKEFHFELSDNYSLDPLYVESLKQEFTGLFYKRYIQGLWVMAEGVIYDMWDEDYHIVDCTEILNEEYLSNNRHHYYLSCDYGTSNPTVFGLFVHFDDLDITYLLNEYYYNSAEKRQKTDSEYADDFQEFIKGIQYRCLYLDPSAASFKAELGKRGINVIPANNDVVDGIRFVSSRLNNHKFFVDKSCTNARKEFSSYSWDPKAQQKGEDKPIKQNDHSVDMIRYGLYSHLTKKVVGVVGGFNYA